MSALSYDTKINKEGRLVIPADVRKTLGLVAGDRVRIVLDDSGVHLVTARSMAAGLWANNTSGDAGNSVADVRELRSIDRALSDSKFEVKSEQDTRSEDEIADDVLSALGLDG